MTDGPAGAKEDAMSEVYEKLREARYVPPGLSKNQEWSGIGD
jgi:hypothetical protein